MRRRARTRCDSACRAGRGNPVRHKKAYRRSGPQTPCRALKSTSWSRGEHRHRPSQGAKPIRRRKGLNFTASLFPKGRCQRRAELDLEAGPLALPSTTENPGAGSPTPHKTCPRARTVEPASRRHGRLRKQQRPRDNKWPRRQASAQHRMRTEASAAILATRAMTLGADGSAPRTPRLAGALYAHQSPRHAAWSRLDHVPDLRHTARSFAAGSLGHGQIRKRHESRQNHAVVHAGRDPAAQHGS